MFFLGLLSTPMPYLLLAAFYFFGFAMGMFNNSTGDEPSTLVTSVTIPAEVNQKVVDHSAFYFQTYTKVQNQNGTEILKSEDTNSSYPPDTGIIVHHFKDQKDYQFLFSGFHFSRPPPSFC